MHEVARISSVLPRPGGGRYGVENRKGHERQCERQRSAAPDQTQQECHHERRHDDHQRERVNSTQYPCTAVCSPEPDFHREDVVEEHSEAPTERGAGRHLPTAERCESRADVGPDPRQCSHQRRPHGDQTAWPPRAPSRGPDHSGTEQEACGYRVDDLGGGPPSDPGKQSEGSETGETPRTVQYLKCDEDQAESANECHPPEPEYPRCVSHRNCRGSPDQRSSEKRNLRGHQSQGDPPGKDCSCSGKRAHHELGHHARLAEDEECEGDQVRLSSSAISLIHISESTRPY